MAGRLDGKVALISGAARGMGAAEAKLFVAEGAQVVIGDVLHDEGRALAAEIGAGATYVELDVTAPAAWDAAVATATSQYGGLDVLVNNAGVLRAGMVETMPLATFEQVLAVNVTGTFLGMQKSVPAMRERGRGSIVNISSVAAKMGGAGTIAYTSSKWAVLGMTKSAAAELGRYKIRVNSVHPSGVITPMIAGEDAMSIAQIPQPLPALTRMCKPEEVAELVLWVASDAASYCTGSEFLIDGGVNAGPPAPREPRT
ncbi:MAG TPA: glucose 1-dehydrogenase [Mycobacteriales bacterium]|nr:glucose 1-dehydrogenase [Mycobacteriales bacterium]